MGWLFYAVLSAVFAALTAIFAKVGLKNVNSDLATAIRTAVILVITWGIVLFKGGVAGLPALPGSAGRRASRPDPHTEAAGTK